MTYVLARMVNGAYEYASSKEFASQKAADKHRSKYISKRKGTVYILNKDSYRITKPKKGNR